jgi:hypothetical protein
MIAQIADGFFSRIPSSVACRIRCAILGAGYSVALASTQTLKTIAKCIVWSVIAALFLSPGSDKPYKMFTTSLLFISASLLAGVASGTDARKKRRQ